GTTRRWRVKWRTKRISGARRSAGTRRRRRLGADLDSGPGGPQGFRSVGRQDPLETVMAWLSREPGIAPLHRLPRLQGANLQNAGAHPVFQPPPHDGAVALRDDDIEGDRPAEKMRLASPVGRIVEAEHDGNAGPD